MSEYALKCGVYTAIVGGGLWVVGYLAVIACGVSVVAAAEIFAASAAPYSALFAIFVSIIGYRVCNKGERSFVILFCAFCIVGTLQMLVPVADQGPSHRRQILFDSPLSGVLTVIYPILWSAVERTGCPSDKFILQASSEVNNIRYWSR